MQVAKVIWVYKGGVHSPCRTVLATVPVFLGPYLRLVVVDPFPAALNLLGTG